MDQSNLTKRVIDSKNAKISGRGKSRKKQNLIPERVKRSGKQIEKSEIPK